MLIFPEIAGKVQKEIENVVGSERLPKVADRVNLPYTEAAWKESLRWNTSAPLGVSILIQQSPSSNCLQSGVPHQTADDEVIGGYFIPKGTVINPNVGCVSVHQISLLFPNCSVGS
jgi:cytochrome P450